jgi:hypothetical protein
MKITNTLRAACLAVAATILASCASAPKMALRPEAKQSIKRIALVEVQEPPRYFMYPGQMPGGAALYLFGALGGAVLGGIEASRTESATTRFTSAVMPLKPELSGVLIGQLETGLRNKGYDVLRVAAPPNKADGKDPDYSKVEGKFDAILATNLVAGYSNDSGAVAPRVSVSVVLLSQPGTSKVFEDTYIYSLRKVGELVQIVPDPKFSVATVDAVYDHIDTAVEGLRTATAKIAERVVADL